MWPYGDDAQLEVCSSDTQKEPPKSDKVVMRVTPLPLGTRTPLEVVEVHDLEDAASIIKVYNDTLDPSPTPKKREK